MSSSTIDRPHKWILVLGLLLGLMVATTAHAEPKAFKSSYKAGKTALQSGAFQQALDHFRQSLRDAGDHQAASWKGMIGVAFAFRGLEQPGYALEYYRRFIDHSAKHEKMLPPKWRARREAVQSEVSELENQALETHALVSMASSPEGAQLSVNAIDAGADGNAVTPHPLYLKPGDHTITLSLEGYEDVTRTFSVTAGELVPVSVTLTPVAKPAAPTAPAAPAAKEASPPPPVATQPDETTEPKVASTPITPMAEAPPEEAGSGPYIMFGVSGAAAAVAIGLTVAAASKTQELEERERYYAELPEDDPALYQGLTGKEAREAIEELNGLASGRADLQMGSNISYGVALAAVVTGVIWLLVAEPSEDDEASSAQLFPVFGISPQGDGALTSATWRF